MKSRNKSKMRKSTKYMLISISIILLILSLSGFIQNVLNRNTNTITKTKEIYKYTNKFNYDYKIKLIKNNYMTEEDLENKNLTYVTDLIDNIDLNLNYEYIADKSAPLDCTYSVTGKMQAVYVKNGEELKVWEKEEVLLNEKTLNEVNTNLKINENIKLDLKDKNELINNFKQQLGMSLISKYTVNLNIKVKTNVEGKEVINEIKPVLNIDLAEKTTSITGENNIRNTQYISKEYKETKQFNISESILYIVMAIVAVILYKYAAKAKVANTVRNEYKYELNRILKLCQDRIVEISMKPNDSGLEIIFVKDFGEIVKVSEELFKPILYYNEKNNEEAYFSVMSEKSVYRYILNNKQKYN